MRSTYNDLDDIQSSQQQRSNSPIVVSTNVPNISNDFEVDEPVERSSSLTVMPNSDPYIKGNAFENVENTSGIPGRFSDELATSLLRSREKPGIKTSVLPNEISHTLPTEWKQIPVIEKHCGKKSYRSFGPEYCNFFAKILSAH